VRAGHRKSCKAVGRATCGAHLLTGPCEPKLDHAPATVDPFSRRLPAKMPSDYAKSFRKALPATPGRERIEANLADEPPRPHASVVW
jgi:hypothetical protein